MGRRVHKAAAGGRLEAMKWARVHDCPWDTRTCACAATSGSVLLTSPPIQNVSGVAISSR